MRTREMFRLAGQADDQKVMEAATSLGELNTPGPLMVRRPVVTGAADEPTTAADLRPGPATILVVDDSRVGRMLVETVLGHDGHRVVGASSGIEALEILAQLKPDLIVLDINMPEMDGFELCQRIRALPDTRSTPVIFLSAQCSLAERAHGVNVGGDDFLRKPFEGGELASRVRLHLKRAKSLGSNGAPAAS
jgi:CheY-like chemotaxis protein